MTETSVEKIPVRWGILGTGRIAGLFAEGLTALPDAELLAVGSRSQASADEFAESRGIERRYASYADLASDPDVDVVYVATPHVYHMENARLCIENGKAVLVEKPFTVNAREAREVIKLARERNVFLMEAMWTRFFPLMEQVRAMISDGTIGEPMILTVDFGFRSGINPSSRLWDLKLGGGALLDVGVYCVSLASMIFGSPSEIASLTHLGETGVDEQSATVLKHGGGQMAVLTTAIRTSTPQTATIMGSEGFITVHSNWWSPTSMTLSANGEEKVIEAPIEGNGMNYEAAEVMRRLRSGETESEIMPLDETLSVLGTMDEVRAQWGLKYPTETV